jgi:hypothetical protein
MNTHKEYYRVRVLRKHKFKVATRAKQIEWEKMPKHYTYPEKVKRAIKYLIVKGWNYQSNLF